MAESKKDKNTEQLDLDHKKGEEKKAKTAAAEAKAESKDMVPSAGDDDSSDQQKNNALLALRTPPNEPLGMDSIDDSDLTVIRCTLGQEKSDRAPVLGQFNFSGLGEAHEEFECNFLLIQKTRVFFAKPFKKGADPLCRSNDAITPVDDTERPPPASHCRDCPKGQWIKKVQECSLCYNFLALLDDGTPFWINFRGGSARAGKDFINMVYLKHRREGLQMLQARLKLIVKLVNSDSGDYYVPVIEVVRWMDANESAPYLEAYERLAAVQYEEESQGDNETATVDGASKVEVSKEDNPFPQG
jgi:hypothetical protein